MRRPDLLGLILLLSLLLPMGLAQPAAAKPAVWIVRDANSTILLFGSAHALPEGLDWRPPELKAALATADDLWLETSVDPAAQAEVARIAKARGQLPQGKSLSLLLSPQARVKLARLEKRLSVSHEALDRMKPWTAEITLTLAAVLREGGTGSDGVEQQVQRLAPRKVRRRYLESGAQQVDLLDRTPMAAQIASLEATIREIDANPGAYRDLVRAWADGDTATIQRFGEVRVKAVSPVLYRRLVSERNARWTQVIRNRLAGHGATVVVVGAGHLVGPDGIPARLRAVGIKVEGP